MDELSIISTADGSHSVFNPALGETYHSVHGAIQESTHVFINAGLHCWLEQNPVRREIRILEIGFGTGLNAFLTLLQPVLKSKKTYYESWEAFPVEEKLYTQLNYSRILESPGMFTSIHTAPWDQPVFITDNFTLRKVKSNVLTGIFETGFDMVYYDAFAPSKQPDMWTAEVLGRMVKALAPGGFLVTYCAKGQVKRDLRSLGMVVETLPGPPGKMQMIRARR